MDILCPTNHVSEVRALGDAGATELYCGVMRPELLEEYTGSFSLNSRHVAEASLPGFDELAQLVSAVHDRGMKVYAAYNAIYPPMQQQILRDEIDSAAATGIDGLIIADVPLMIYTRKHHPEVKIIASTLAGAFNSRTCALFSKLGAGRITLPRSLTVEEIERTADMCPGTEFEVFAMSERCYFSNALCHFEHATYRTRGGFTAAFADLARRTMGRRMAALTGSYSNRFVNSLQDAFVARNGMMCCRKYTADLVDKTGEARQRGLEFRFVDTWNNFREACGLCALYDIARVPGVKSVKIVGRQSLTSRKKWDVEMVRRALELLEAGMSRQEFESRVKEIRKEYYPLYCGEGFCYYARRQEGPADVEVLQDG